MGGIDPFRAAVNTISIPPGEYGRKGWKLKGIDGGPHKQWSMWFNSKQREEPYQSLDIPMTALEIRLFFGTSVTGGAWLSSARVVRCWVKSRNERNPYG